MKKILVHNFDAFSSIPNKGNPAGVVIDAEKLTDDEMQEIACKVGFSETAFVISSEKANFGIRYFTPGHEINLCGHATIATLYCLKSRGMLGDIESLTIETKAGIFPIKFSKEDNSLRIRMNQASPQFKKFEGSIDKLAYSLGLEIEDIDMSIPILYGSTGTWTLLVPIKKLEKFSKMIPKNSLFPNILNELPHCSVHPFCLETVKKHTHMHARHFSSPFSGTTEDPITGTASGVMGAYYVAYIDQNAVNSKLIVEQGQEIGRDGEVSVYVNKKEDEIKVSIAGTAVYVNDIRIEYN